MADIENDDDLDRDDLGAVDDDQEDLRAILRKAMNEGGREADPASDDIALDPLEASEITTVSTDEGLDLIEKSKRGEAKPKGTPPAEPDEVARKAAEEAAATAAKAGAQEAGNGAAPEAEAEKTDPPPAAASDLDSLLEGIDPERAGKIRDRLATFAGLDEVFVTHKDTLDAIAQGEGGPAKAITNLLGLHQYANQNPDQYLAWAATQLGGADPEAVIIKAAEHLGLKVAKPEEDPFEDEEIRKLREENRTLKAQGRRLPFGPDVRSPQDQIGAFAAEKNQDGTPKRPFWDQLHPQIAARAKAEREKTGQPVTLADIDRFYREEETRMRALFAPPAEPNPAPNTLSPAPKPTPAAPAAPAVPQVVPKTAAPAAGNLARAQAASKQLDGTGQGADRHSAPPDGADLRGTIAHYLRQARGD